jgi:hypothetical protein
VINLKTAKALALTVPETRGAETHVNSLRFSAEPTAVRAAQRAGLQSLNA